MAVSLLLAKITLLKKAATWTHPTFISLQLRDHPIWQLAFWSFTSLGLRDPWNGGPFATPHKKKKFIWTSFSEQFPLGSWLVSQGRRQKFARSSRTNSRKRGVLEYFGIWVGFGVSNLKRQFATFPDPKDPKIEKIQSRLKFSISIENFNPDWKLQSRRFRIPHKK